MASRPSVFSARRYVFLGVLTIAILVGGFGLWSVTANISGAIIAPGEIEVEQNRQVVQHLDGGVVASVEVHEGDLVKLGDVLISLDPSLLTIEHRVAEGSLFEVLARRGRLEAERDGLDEVNFDPELMAQANTREDVRALTDGQTRLFQSRVWSMASEVSQLEKRIGQINSQIAGQDAQSTALNAQLALIRQELVSQQTLLEKGLTQAARVLALQREEASILGQQGNLIALRAENEGRITEVEIQILRLATLRREEAITQLRDLGFSQLELSEELRGLEQKLDRLDIRAPVAGIVHGLTVFAERAVIRPAEPVLYLVPQDRELLIVARVNPIHVDEVFVGQKVVVRFAAFDSRTTPELFGRVITVSPDAFTDEATGMRFYRAGINLAEGEAAKLPEGLALIPGMPADAYIRTSDRTPLAYLVKPLTDYFNKAFREK
ncbi:MAG: HlyD family type I secretion periplasmic adaptor subunit [Rhodobacteraceae bacterium]|nr:HlyD family type I secretion periplasmic adaptor subunit [Paracoccaceae bacterium]